MTQGKARLQRNIKAEGYALLDVGYYSNELSDLVESKQTTAVIAYRNNRILVHFK